nr:G-protein coupled receptor 84-like [Lytechinus pictus]
MAATMALTSSTVAGAVTDDNITFENEEEFHTGLAEIFEATFLVLVSILGTFGNILVIAAVLSTPTLRTRGNVFIIFLAITDLITTAFLAPFFIFTLLKGGWPYAEIYCDILGYAALICLSLSVMSLGLIAITRYVAVTRPKHVFQKQCNTCVIIIAFGVLATLNCLIVILPELAQFGSVGYNSDLGHCSMLCSEDRDWWYCATLFLGGVVTTMTITPAYYALTLWVVRKSRITVAAINRNSERHHANVKGNVPQAANRAPTLSREEIRLTKKLMLLFLIFFICWFPYSIVIFTDRNGIVPTPLHRFTNLFVWVNSCLNPYLYAWMMRSFRNAYKSVTKFHKWRKYLPCKKVREGVDSGSSIIMTRGATL